MVVISSQHRGDGPLKKDTGYTPIQAWPEDCTVQWGGKGVVISRKGNYKTAFFEAFPDGPGFFRGEGASIAEAEQECFAKFSAFKVCDHQWGRGSYTNGGTICHRCKSFASTMNPITVLGAYKAPISFFELSSTAEGALRPSRYADHDTAVLRRFSRRTYLRLRLAGVDIPPTPREPGKGSIFSDDNDDPYIVACRKAVCDWYKANHLDCAGRPEDSLMSGFFHDFEHSMLQRMVSEDDEYQSSINISPEI
ncbi:hypothetical protein [Pseudosulfitobacter pseudonitzschiae]|uniref:hypothetical protein n=1 Tax=Pseudosulfitobacter pseudonitzschiae TaxID=1402135 RepID=UPI003B78C066